jgi:hypothetical protein
MFKLPSPSFTGGITLRKLSYLSESVPSSLNCRFKKYLSHGDVLRIIRDNAYIEKCYRQ